MLTLLTILVSIGQIGPPPTTGPPPTGGGGGDPMEYLTYAVVFAAVAFFVVTGLMLFGKGWQSYEEKYLDDAERNLEAMFLTIPPQNLFYLAFLLFFILAGGITAYSGNIGLAIVIGSMAFFMPMAALRFFKRRREVTFKDMLVPALQCLGNNLKSGFSLEKAFEQLEKESQNPMKQEVKILLQELRLGTNIDEAVSNMYKRMPSEDMDLVANAVNIAAKAGGNLPMIFKKLEETIRERTRVEGKLAALTAQGKFQAIVISALPALVFVAMQTIYPEMMDPLFDTLWGWIMMAAVIILNLIGFLIIRKIVTIEI